MYHRPGLKTMFFDNILNRLLRNLIPIPFPPVFSNKGYKYAFRINATCFLKLLINSTNYQAQEIETHECEIAGFHFHTLPKDQIKLTIIIADTI